MRILHIADLHLGQTFHEHARDAEHDVVLAQILDALDAHAVDALLVAGDVFHSLNPSTTAQAQWYRFLVEARRRRPSLDVVAVAGNHDSVSRFEVVQPFARPLGVRLLGRLPRGADGALDPERLLVPLHDEAGRRRAWCVAVPYLRPADLRVDSSQPGWQRRGVERVYAEAFELARARREPGEGIVATGHLQVAGTPFPGDAERRTPLDGAAPAAELFPDDVAYAALGHIHLPQAVGGRENVRYAGSPLPLSMAEIGYPHQAVLIELDDAGAFAGCQACPLRPPVEFVRVPSLSPGRTSADLAEVVRQLEGLPDDDGETPRERWPFLAVHTRPSESSEAIKQAVAQAVHGKAVRFVQLRIERLTPAEQAERDAYFDRDELDVEPRTLAALDPEEVFALRYEQVRGDERVPPEMLAHVRELVAQAREAEPVPED